MSIESIKQRAAAATPGPTLKDMARRLVIRRHPTDGNRNGFWTTLHANTALNDLSAVGVPELLGEVAHSRTDIDLLLAVAEAAKDYREQLSRPPGGSMPGLCNRLDDALDALEAAP